MPELPEVETVKEILKTIILHRTITNVEVFYPNLIKSSPPEFVPSLINQKVIDIKRIGKYLIFVLPNKKVLISHLRMEGKYLLLRDGEGKTKHTGVIFHLDNGARLCYDDSRKFGIMMIADLDNYLSTTPVQKVGIEPIAIHETAQYNQIYRKIISQKRAIKVVLLDQTILAGLGNIYVDETLFMARIHPETPCHLLTYEEIIKIIKCASTVLLKAISAGGSTIKSYHPGRDVDGKFQEELLCYGKSGQPCPTCQTTLRKIFVTGRGTTYCPKCQKNRNLPYVLGVTGVIASGKTTACLYLKSLGAEVISSDQIVHQLYADPTIVHLLEQKLKTTLKRNGKFDSCLLKTAMENIKNKQKVEKIIHPLVEKKLIEFIKNAPTTVVALEVPLLFEANLDYLCDATLAIEVSKNQQIANLKSRGIKDYQPYLSLNSTNRFSEYKEKVTYLIISDGNLESLKEQIFTIYEKIKNGLINS